MYYANDTSGNLAYTVSYKTGNPATRPDSFVFTYANGRLSTKTIYWQQADILAAVYQEMLSYDAAGNITQVQGFRINADGISVFNVAYDFVYDNHPEPFYLPDDMLHVYNWYYGTPNNVIKGINHPYYAATGNDDYVDYAYEYDNKNRPVAVKSSGPFIETSHSYYYYK